MTICLWTGVCYVALGCAIIIYAVRRHIGSTRSTFPLPPGPPGLPWIGNVIGINPRAPWLTYTEWAKTYGDLIHSRVLGKDIIIINSEKAAKDLLDKRSLNNSDRPCFSTSDLSGVGFNSALLPYGDGWRLHRRFFHQAFRMEAIDRFIPFQHRKACQFLQQLLNGPEQLDKHVFEYTAAIILNSTYDYEPPSWENNELIKIVAEVQEIVMSVVRPEIAITLETFPIIMKLPTWFPGMSFKKRMEISRKLTRQYVETTFAYSLQKVQECSTAPSMVHDGFRSIEGKGTAPDESWVSALKEAAATSYLAGSETSYAALMTFFLVMVLNPEAQEKAQAQIDTVVGKTRLPNLNDRPSLPFLDAIIREMFRCWPIVPLCIPHASTDDDVYNGFYIPKGSILFANVWSMGHDESRYPNAHTFKPERFIDKDGSLKPNDIDYMAFGFGRRICVGKYIADVSIWAVIAKVLAVFKILKPLDENGLEISVEPRFSSGLAIHPLPFPCRIVPRQQGMDARKLDELIAASTSA